MQQLPQIQKKIHFEKNLQQDVTVFLGLCSGPVCVPFFCVGADLFTLMLWCTSCNF